MQGNLATIEEGSVNDQDAMEEERISGNIAKVMLPTELVDHNQTSTPKKHVRWSDGWTLGEINKESEKELNRYIEQ